MRKPFPLILLLASTLLPACVLPSSADDIPRYRPDGTWQTLSLEDFVNVNGESDTWSEVDGNIVCTGKPLGGARTTRTYTNFEMTLEWKHHTHGGNSGLFLWCPEEAFTDLPPGQLPRTGIEVQILDLGYEENWEASKGEPSDWFTSHGDLFPVGQASMKAQTPMIAYVDAEGEAYAVGNLQSSRSFPTRRLVKPAGEWNRYAVRAIDGEVTLWVNGVQVNRGFACEPSSGYLALEAEGALVEFRALHLKELP